MSTALNARRAAIIIGGISAAVVCASAAVHWYLRTRPSVRHKLSKSKRHSISPKKRRPESRNQISQPQVTDKEVVSGCILEKKASNSSIESSSSEREIEMTTTMASSYSPRESGRGGRRDYRHRRNPDQTSPTQMSGYCVSDENTVVANVSKSAFQSVQPQVSCVSKHCQTGSIFNDPAIVESSAPVTNGVYNSSYNSHQIGENPQNQKALDAEIRGAQLAAEFSAKCQMISSGNNNMVNGINGEADYSNANQHVIFQNGVAHDAPSPSSIKGQCIESPSLASDLQSEGSQDSGKGASSTGLTSSMSPVEEFIEIPAVYEFEVPQDIVGLLIGKQGMTIKWLTQESRAHIIIRQHVYSDRHKICTLEGTREQINKCLRLIRRKFPPSRFPDLKLTPIIIPPPVSTPHTPVWDNVIQLNLLEGAKCEAVISSIVGAGHFFIQQPTHPTFPSLTRLDQYMVAVYSQPLGVPPLPRPVDAGVICAAPILGGWYRAQTMETSDETEILVKFVDYGGYSRLPVSDLRQIRSDFMTLPFQATECYLAHVKPVDEKEGWSQEATTAFEQLSQGKVLEALIVGHAADNIPLVELYLPSQNGEIIMINRLLTENGHAVWTE